MSARVRNFFQSVVLIVGMGLIVAACTWLLGGEYVIPWALLALGLLLFVAPRIAPEFIMRRCGAWRAEHWPVRCARGGRGRRRRLSDRRSPRASDRRGAGWSRWWSHGRDDR